MNKLCTFDLSVQLNPGVSIFCFELRELYTTLLFGTKKNHPSKTPITQIS